MRPLILPTANSIKNRQPALFINSSNLLVLLTSRPNLLCLFHRRAYSNSSNSNPGCSFGGLSSAIAVQEQRWICRRLLLLSTSVTAEENCIHQSRRCFQSSASCRNNSNNNKLSAAKQRQQKNEAAEAAREHQALEYSLASTSKLKRVSLKSSVAATKTTTTTPRHSIPSTSSANSSQHHLLSHSASSINLMNPAKRNSVPPTSTPPVKEDKNVKKKEAKVVDVDVVVDPVRVVVDSLQQNRSKWDEMSALFIDDGQRFYSSRLDRLGWLHLFPNEGRNPSTFQTPQVFRTTAWNDIFLHGKLRREKVTGSKFHQLWKSLINELGNVKQIYAAQKIWWDVGKLHFTEEVGQKLVSEKADPIVKLLLRRLNSMLTDHLVQIGVHNMSREHLMHYLATAFKISSPDYGQVVRRRIIDQLWKSGLTKMQDDGALLSLLYVNAYSHMSEADFVELSHRIRTEIIGDEEMGEDDTRLAAESWMRMFPVDLYRGPVRLSDENFTAIKPLCETGKTYLIKAFIGLARDPAARDLSTMTIIWFKALKLQPDMMQVLKTDPSKKEVFEMVCKLPNFIDKLSMNAVGRMAELLTVIQSQDSDLLNSIFTKLARSYGGCRQPLPDDHQQEEEVKKPKQTTIFPTKPKAVIQTPPKPPAGPESNSSSHLVESSITRNPASFIDILRVLRFTAGQRTLMDDRALFDKAIAQICSDIRAVQTGVYASCEEALVELLLLVISSSMDNEDHPTMTNQFISSTSADQLKEMFTAQIFLNSLTDFDDLNSVYLSHTMLACAAIGESEEIDSKDDLRAKLPRFPPSHSKRLAGMKEFKKSYEILNTLNSKSLGAFRNPQFSNPYTRTTLKLTKDYGVDRVTPCLLIPNQPVIAFAVNQAKDLDGGKRLKIDDTFVGPHEFAKSGRLNKDLTFFILADEKRSNPIQTKAVLHCARQIGLSVETCEDALKDILFLGRNSNSMVGPQEWESTATVSPSNQQRSKPPLSTSNQHFHRQLNNGVESPSSSSSSSSGGGDIKKRSKTNFIKNYAGGGAAGRHTNFGSIIDGIGGGSLGI